MEGEVPPAYETTIDEAPPAYDTTVGVEPAQPVPSAPEEEVKKDKPLVSFKTDIGCSIHDIATVFEQESYSSKLGLWERLVKTKSELTSFIEIYTIIIGLVIYTRITLKTQNNSNKPPQHVIKSLTEQLITKLPQNINGEPMLSKEEFSNNLSNTLFNIHQEMTNDDPRDRVQQPGIKTDYISLDIVDQKSPGASETPNDIQYDTAADATYEQRRKARMPRILNKRIWVIRGLFVLFVVLCVIIYATTEWGGIWFIMFFGGLCECGLSECVLCVINNKPKSAQVQQSPGDFHFGNYNPAKESTIVILSFHHKFLCSEAPTALDPGKLSCNSMSAPGFKSIPMGVNQVALQTDNERYITALSTGKLEQNNSSLAKELETFEVIKQSNGTFTFKSNHNKYLSAQSDGSLECNRNVAREWEQFYVSDINGIGLVGSLANYDSWIYDLNIEYKIALYGCHKKYLCAEARPRYNMVCNRSDCIEWERFTPIPKGGNTVGLRSHHGKYLSAQVSGKLEGNRNKLAGWEIFTVEQQDGKFGFKSCHGKYLSAQPDGRIEINRDDLQAWELFEVYVFV